MARPESINDIKPEDRITRIATFEIDRFMADPALLKNYTGLLEIVKKMGGEVQKSYSSMDFYVPKTKTELENQLRTDQSVWDDNYKYYNLALNRGPGDSDIPEWRRSSIKSWSILNELPDPFDVFAANDPELAQLRSDLGMED